MISANMVVQIHPERAAMLCQVIEAGRNATTALLTREAVAYLHGLQDSLWKMHTSHKVALERAEAEKKAKEAAEREKAAAEAALQEEGE